MSESDLFNDQQDVKLIPSLSDRSERFMGWPSLRVEIELAPWYWRVSWYRAPLDGHFMLLQIGPVVVHLWA